MDIAEDGEVEAEFIVGTYQEFVVGYKLFKNSSKNKVVYSLKQSFTNHAHAKSVRAIAAIGKYVASGSADETIKLINFQTRAEHGYLQPQQGTITCLASFGSNHLLSGGQDGSICIWRSGSWRCEKTLENAHPLGVNSICIHPSGKLAMSIGQDKSLKTWNLIKGRTGFITNLKVVPDSIQFSPEGTLYAVGLSNRVDVFELETAKVIYSIPFGKRASCLCFKDEQILFVGGDMESVEIHNVTNSKKLTIFTTHKNRVKDMKYLHHLNILVTVSNDGFIKVWKFPEKETKFCSPPSLLTEVDTTCRIICLAVWTKDLVTDVPESSPEVSEDEEEEEEENVVITEVLEKVKEKKKKLKKNKIKIDNLEVETINEDVILPLPPKSKSKNNTKSKKKFKREAVVTVEIDTPVISNVLNSKQKVSNNKKLKRSAEVQENESDSTLVSSKVKKVKRHFFTN